MEVNDEVAKFGAVVKGAASYPARSPYLRIACQQRERMFRFLSEFGMTPSSRSRCTVTKQDDPGPYAKFVRRT